jgi:hypothetical protein
MQLSNRRIEHNGVLYEFTGIYGGTRVDKDNGAAGFLERNFPDEKERNEIKGRMIEHQVACGNLRRVEPKKIELVKDGLFYMEDT